MKIKKRLKLDRQAFSQLNHHDRLVFLWDYYKIPILALVCAAVLTVVTVLTTASRGKVAMYAVFVNTASPEGDRQALEALLAQGGVDMSGRRVDVTADLHLGQGLEETGNAQSIQILAALFGISGLDFFAADQPVFDMYAKQGAFVDLAFFLDGETLERHREDLCYYPDATGHQVLMGIRLPPGSGLHQAGYFLTDVVVGVAANAQNMEEAVCFLRQLL